MGFREVLGNLVESTVGLTSLNVRQEHHQRLGVLSMGHRCISSLAPRAIESSSPARVFPGRNSMIVMLRKMLARKGLI